MAFAEDGECLECGGPRPHDGWPTIQDGFDTWIGRVLDARYLVSRRVGRGAVGTVYRVDSLAINRDFAIKIINIKEAPTGVEPDQIRSRLHREIEALGRLRNPHIVPFYEVLELFDAYVGIVMDFVRGLTLEDLVQQEGPLPLRRALTLLRQMANGIHEAHQAGMIHRDLKPENLMVERMPAGDDFVHILDFGIVRLDDGVSMTRGFLGTPLYASPEQAMAGSIDRRSDVYSLGAILFFLLTGRPPYVSDSVYEILSAHVRSAVPTLAEAAPNRRFPEPVEALLRDMLAKSPERRPHNLSIVIERLDELLRMREVLRADIDEPDSMELQPVAETRAQTGEQSAVLVPLGQSTGSEIEQGRRRSVETDPQGHPGVFTGDRDGTGPKAAIYRRGTSRSTVKKLVDQDRKAHQTLTADRIVRETSGHFPLGARIDGDIVRCVADGDGRLAVLDTQGRIYRVVDGESTLLFRESRPIGSMALAKDTILLGYADGTVAALEGKDRPRVGFQDVRRVAVNAVASDSHATLLLAGSESGRVYMQRRGGEWQRIQDGPPVVSMAVDSVGSVFAVARKHREVELFNASNPRAPFMRFSVQGFPVTIAFSRDGHLVACLLEDGGVVLHMTLTGERVMSIRDEAERLATLAFTTQNELVGYFDQDGSLFGLDLQRELTRIGAAT